MQQQPASSQPVSAGAIDSTQRGSMPWETFIQALQRITQLCSGNFDLFKASDVKREVSALCSERLSHREVALVVGTLSCIAIMQKQDSWVSVIGQALQDILNAHLGKDISGDDRVSGVFVVKLLQAVAVEAQRVQNPRMYQMVLDALHLNAIPLTAAEQCLVWRAVGEEWFASSRSPTTGTSEEHADLPNPRQLFLKREFFKDIFELVAPIEREYSGGRWRGIPRTEEFASMWLCVLDRQNAYPLPSDLGADQPEFAYLVRELFQRFCRSSCKSLVDHEEGQSDAVRQDTCKPSEYLIRYFITELQANRAKDVESDSASEYYCDLAMRLTYNLILKGEYAEQIRSAEDALVRLFKRVEAGDLRTPTFETERVADIPLADGRATMEWSCPPESKEDQPQLSYPLSAELSQSQLRMKLMLEMGLVYGRKIKAHATVEINGRRIDFGRFQVGLLNEALLLGQVAIPMDSALLKATERGTHEVPSVAAMSRGVPMTPEEFSNLLKLFIQLDEAASYVNTHFQRSFAS